MKNLFLTMLLLSVSLLSLAQERKIYGQIYDTAADMEVDIRNAIDQAQSEHKNVLLQIGGNWCIWCIRFHQFVAKNDTLNQLLHANYVPLLVNYDKKNSEAPLWKGLGYPQRFGFPVFVILDETGHLIHIQNSAYLEDADSYSAEKVAGFLKQWSPAAIQGKTL